MALLFAESNEELMSMYPTVDDALAGGFVTFNGRVRRFNREHEVSYLMYEAHISLAQSLFQDLEREATLRFNVLCSAAVHRLGRVNVGQDAVVISVCTRHRHEAYLASCYLIDELKKTLPIWKKEVYTDGSHIFSEHVSSSMQRVDL